MKIKWLGQACFHIEAETITVVTDPYNSSIGFSLPKDLTADVITVSHSHDDHNNIDAVSGHPLVIANAGETVCKTVSFQGVESFHDGQNGAQRGKNMIFTFTLDGVRITHLGDLGHTLSADQIKSLEHTEILLIPVGGVYTIDAVRAVKVIKQINPKIVIPMHYRIPQLRFELDPIIHFIEKSKQMPLSREILEVTKETLPEKTEIIILRPLQVGNNP